MLYRSGTTRAETVDMSKAFDRVWYAHLLHKLKTYGILGQMCGLILSFLSNRWLGVVLDGNSSQEYQVYAGVPQSAIIGHTIFLILLSMLILLSTVSVIRRLICGNN